MITYFNADPTYRTVLPTTVLNKYENYQPIFCLTRIAFTFCGRCKIRHWRLTQHKDLFRRLCWWVCFFYVSTQYQIIITLDSLKIFLTIVNESHQSILGVNTVYLSFFWICAHKHYGNVRLAHSFFQILSQHQMKTPNKPSRLILKHKIKETFRGK